jgi:hypothetical protein
MNGSEAEQATGTAASATTGEREDLLVLGFTAAEAARLIALKRQRAGRRPPDISQQRLLFARWLVANHRLNEGTPLGATARPAQA